MLLLQYGNMSKELTKYNTQLFAEKVMPQLKDLFADWEDKWWPKPMARGAARRAARLRRPTWRPNRAAGREHAASPIRRRPTVDVNGFPRRVWSKGSGPELGFLAGFGGLPRWMPFLDELAEHAHRHRAVAAGLSRRRPRPHRARHPSRLAAWRCARSLRESRAGRRRSCRQLGRRLVRGRDGGDLAGHRSASWR